MARKKQRYPTISKGADGQWHAWVPVDRPDGTSSRRHIKRETEDAVEEAVDELLEQTAASIPVAPGRTPSFRAWMETYLDTIAPRRCDPGTIRDYRSLCTHWAYPVAGRLAVDRFAPSHLDAIFVKMDAAGRAVSTQIKIHRVITRALEIAHRRGLVGRNVAKLVDPPQAIEQEQDSLDLDQALAVIQVALERRNGVRWAIGLALGERQGEALGLRWPYLDLDAAEVRIWWQLRRRAFAHGCGGTCGRRRGGNCPQRDLQLREGESAVRDLSRPATTDRRTGLVLKPPKGKSKRTVPIPQDLVELLRKHQMAQGIERILAGDSWQDHGFVFARHDGQPIDPKHDYQEWREILAEAGVQMAEGSRTGVHLGRHTAASLLIFLGAPIEVVQEILGHSDIRIARRYAHVASEMAKSATQRMGSALFNTGAAP